MDIVTNMARKADRCQKQFERSPSLETKRAYYAAYNDYLRVVELSRLGAVKLWIKRAEAAELRKISK